MPRVQPKVVTGLKGPGKVEGREKAPLAGPVAAKANEVVYESVVKNYRLQITAPFDIVDTRTGRVTAADPKVAQFRENVFITEDTEVIEIMDAGSCCGVGKEYWRQTDLTAAVEQRKDDEIRAFVAAHPEKVKAFLQEREAKDVSELAE